MEHGKREDTFVRFVSRSAYAQAAGLRCGGYGYEACKTHLCGPRRLGSYAALWIPRGSGWIETEATPGRLRVEPASLVWLFPSVTHRYAPDPGGWTEHWVLFVGAMAAAFEREGLLAPARPVLTLRSGAEIEEVSELVSRLHSDFATRASAADVLGASTLTRLILTVCQRESVGWDEPAGGALSRTAVGQARQWIDAHATEEIDFHALAQKVGLAGSTFRRHFAAATGLSPKAYQTQARLTKAKELLAYTQWSVAKIALATGFADAYYFSRLFRRKEDLTPGMFRRQYHFAAKPGASDPPLVARQVEGPA